MMVFGGLIIAGIPGMLPVYLPAELSFLCFLFGTVLAMAGLGMLSFRAKKTGADRLIEPARPGYPLWFYIYGDGEVRILNSKREGESYLSCAELDSLIPDIKTYSLSDHKIRFVPEGCSHAVDLAVVEYTQLMDRHNKFQGLSDARRKIFAKLQRNPQEDSQEFGKASESIYPQLRSR